GRIPAGPHLLEDAAHSLAQIGGGGGCAPHDGPPLLGRELGEADTPEPRCDQLAQGGHGSSFSTGTTRMPLAPAARSRDRIACTWSDGTTAWTATMSSCASGMTDGESSPGRISSIASSDARGAFIMRYLTRRPATTASSIVTSSAARSARRGSGVPGPTRM